ncbi:hypothetical protein KRM28CT15_14960 [Krasilnikovia sp. M28-CT-15]
MPVNSDDHRSEEAVGDVPRPLNVSGLFEARPPQSTGSFPRKVGSGYGAPLIDVPDVRGEEWPG